MKVAICDDELAFREQLYRLTNAYVTEKGIHCAITTFASGEELLESDDVYDIVLLDVQLTGMDGMQVAMKLKVRNRATLIVFISSFIQYAPQGYQSAIRYLLKPQLEDDFPECMDAALAQIASQQDYLTVPVGKRTQKVPLAMILYLESSNRRIRLELEPEAQQVFPDQCYGKIEDYAALLCKKGFCHCHKSYLINFRKVQALQGSSFLMTNGVEVPISRRLFAKSNQEYNIFRAESEEL